MHIVLQLASMPSATKSRSRLRQNTERHRNLQRDLRRLQRNLSRGKGYIFTDLQKFFTISINRHPLYNLPITVVERSKAWNIFAGSNTGIMGSNPTQGMDVCLCLFCVFLRWWPCDGLILRPRSPTDCLKLTHWSETKRFTDALCFKWEQQEWKKKKKKTI
jgi:hypothetical protein